MTDQTDGPGPFGLPISLLTLWMEEDREAALVRLGDISALRAEELGTASAAFGDIIMSLLDLGLYLGLDLAHCNGAGDVDEADQWLRDYLRRLALRTS